MAVLASGKSVGSVEDVESVEDDNDGGKHQPDHDSPRYEHLVLISIIQPHITCKQTIIPSPSLIRPSCLSSCLSFCPSSCFFPAAFLRVCGKGCLDESTADGADGDQGPEDPLSDGEVVEGHCDTVEALDGDSDEPPVVPEINYSLPEGKGAGYDDSQGSPVLETFAGQQGDDDSHPEEGELGDAEPGLQHHKPILHVDFESVEELVDLVRLKLPLVDVVAETEGPQLNVESVVDDSDRAENGPDVGRPGNIHVDKIISNLKVQQNKA